MHRFFQIQALALTVVIAFYAIHAYASSAQPIPGAEGIITISGWNVSGVRYRLEEGPSKDSAVEFDLDKPATMVKVSVNSSSALFSNCTNTTGTHWYCVINSGTGISEFDELRVIAK